MNAKEVQNNEKAGSTNSANLDMKLEVVVLPVSDVDRAKEFYTRLGWRLDADRAAGDSFRLVQFTPPGSGSSIQFGVDLTSAPGSAQGTLLAVSDIEAARKELVDRGVDVSEVFHCETGTACRFEGIGVRVTGPHPECLSYSLQRPRHGRLTPPIGPERKMTPTRPVSHTLSGAVHLAD